MKSIYDSYSDVLSNQRSWNPTRNTNIEHNIDNLFIEPHTKNFIMEMQFYSEDLLPLSLQTYRRMNIQNPFIKKTSMHTVSLYLLGAYFFQEFSTAGIRMPLWDSDKTRNFLHQWIAICLFHDLGYYIEKNQDDFPPSEYGNLDGFLKRLGISFDLRETDDANLIQNYYRYRVQKHNIIDHGMMGAFVLYDALMKRDQEQEQMAADGVLIISEHTTYGKNNRTLIKSYADIIAKHNMWYASSADQIMTYKNYRLDTLIAKEDGNHRIRIAQNPLLFMLGLFDTIEPMKRYLKEDYSLHHIMKVLKGIKIMTKKVESKITIQIIDEIGSEIHKSASSLEEWLYVKVKQSSSKTEIEIPL